MTNEPLAQPEETESFDARLVEVLDQYMADRRGGTAPGHDELVAQHPELADQLKSCLEGIDLLGKTSLEISGRKQVGDFELGSEIGRGGMGVVYQAHQKSLDRTVALKILNLPISDPTVMERFQREAATAAGLHHTNIVPIFEVGNEGGVHYYAMQMIDGSSLAEVSRDSQKPLDLDTVALWGLQAAEALAYAHQHGVIHRDIKPSNLILDQEGQIWLTDFGLARRLDDVRLSATGAVLGTPRYMSPEQAAAITHPIDERTDIYSLGATLYELACGQPAVPGDTPAAVISSIMKDHRRSPREHRPAISRDLETILLRCLEKHPSDRYGSAAELASDLRALCEHRPITSRPLSMFEKARRWLHQHQVSVRWAAAGGFAAIALLCVGIWFALVYPTLDDAQVQLSTTAAGLRADFTRLDGDSDPVSVFVPTTEAITLDAGQWKARLLVPGGFSQDVRHWFLPGDDRGIFLPSPPKPLWSADEVVSSHPVQVFGRTDMLIITSSVIQLRHGMTGDVIWSRNGQSDELKILNDRGTSRYVAEWGLFDESPRTTFQPSPICAIGHAGGETSDVDGDGHADLLIASAAKPAVLALSGTDGSTLWMGSYEKEIRDQSGASGYRCVWISTLGEAEPLAIFSSNRGSPPTAWIAQLSRVDGAVQWKSKLTFKQSKYGTYTLPLKYVDQDYHGQERFFARYAQHYEFVQQIERHPAWISRVEMVPLVLPLAEDEVLCVLDRDLVRINRTTGNTSVMADFLGADPVQPIQRVRGEGDQTMFLVTTQTKSLDSLAESERMNVRAYSEDFSDVKWQRTVRADFTAPICQLTDEPNLPLVVDLNHDGRDEVILQTDRVDLPSAQYHRGTIWAELQIIDSKGNELLARPLRIASADTQLLHVQVVSDQDGDGWDDLAIATRYSAVRDDRGAVHVELFSSKTAAAIWHQRLEQPQAVNEHAPPEIFRFQRIKVAGRELLLIERASYPGFLYVVHHETAILDAASGQIISVGDRLSVKSIVDPDANDSLLWCCDRTVADIDRNQEGTGKQFKMFASPIDQTVNVSQSATVTADIDGDAMSDLRARRVSRRSYDNFSYVSSATGNLLRPPADSMVNGESMASLSIKTDLTGNGHDDFLAWTSREPPQLLEGSTGFQKWKLSESILIGEETSLLAAVPASLTSFDAEDLIVAAYAEHALAPTFGMAPWDKPLQIFGVRGADGKVLWIQELGKVDSTGGYETLNYDYGDVNDDGLTDFVFSYFQQPNSNAIYVIDGATGKQMMEWTGVHKTTPNWLDRFPKPVIVGNPNRAQIVFMSVVGINQGYELTIADPKTGHLMTESITSKMAYRSNHGIESRWGRHEIVPLKTNNADQQRIAFWIASDSGEYQIHVGEVQNGEFHAIQKPWTVEDDKPIEGPWKTWFRILAADIDFDGNDELILPDPDGVTACKLDGTRIWHHSVDGSCAVLESIRTLEKASECVISVPQPDPRIDVLGLDIRDGSPRWSVRGQQGLALIKAGAVRGMLNEQSPLPTFAYADSQRNFWLTAKARPIEGAVQAPSDPSPPRLELAGQGIDTRWLGAGPYPGSVDVFGARRWRFAGRMLWSIIWAVFAIIVPVLIVVRVILRRQFSVTLMLTATAAVAICFAVLTIPVGNQHVTIANRFAMGLWMTPFFLWVGMLIAFYRREQTVAMLSLLLSPFLLLVIFECYKLVISDPERIVLASDVLRLWRGLLFTIPIVFVVFGPIWVPVWFSRRKRITAKM